MLFRSAENNTAGATVGTFTTTDPDNGQTFTYSLVSGTGSTDNAAFTISGSSLTINASANYEAQSSYSIRVRTTDSGSPALTFDKVFTITVTDFNEAPTNITLSSTSIAENNTAGATVGTFSTTEPDNGQTFTYSLVSEIGRAHV